MRKVLKINLEACVECIETEMARHGENLAEEVETGGELCSLLNRLIVLWSGGYSGMYRVVAQHLDDSLLLQMIAELKEIGLMVVTSSRRYLFLSINKYGDEPSEEVLRYFVDVSDVELIRRGFVWENTHLDGTTSVYGQFRYKRARDKKSVK